MRWGEVELLNEDPRPDAALGWAGVPHTGEAITADGMLVEPQAEDFRSAKLAPSNPAWFKGAVFYEVLVRAFSDSNGDGTGDLRGLADRLDYLRWLGVDCLWLPPFYASPLRDGGYDISDFRALLPQVGVVGGVRLPEGGGASQGYPGDHGPGAQPHLRCPPVVPAVAA